MIIDYAVFADSSFFVVDFIAKFQRELRERERRMTEEGKEFAITRRISETVQDKIKVTMN